jgi:hypothetical protein
VPSPARWCDGRSPVRIDANEGSVHGADATAVVKTTLSDASASIRGEVGRV